METQQTQERVHFDSDMTMTSLTERHLSEWLHLLDTLRDEHAPTDQLAYCRYQVTRLQRDLYQLRNN
ncbi:hypothetical protein ACFS25_14470 [Spirosoma flavum]|uniref:Uncharacterized protein n=1 Tax=Spirosoma flavum TaxID=2048557 RepID=A0ABW6AIK9_9BACT